MWISNLVTEITYKKFSSSYYEAYGPFKAITKDNRNVLQTNTVKKPSQSQLRCNTDAGCDILRYFPGCLFYYLSIVGKLRHRSAYSILFVGQYIKLIKRTRLFSYERQLNGSYFFFDLRWSTKRQSPYVLENTQKTGCL